MPENDEAKPVFLNGNWYIPAALTISFFLLFLANSAGSSGEPDIPEGDLGELICVNLLFFNSLLLGIVFLCMNIVGFTSETRSQEFKMTELSNRTALIATVLGFATFLLGMGALRLTFEVSNYFNFPLEENDPTIEAFSSMSMSSKAMFTLLVISLVPITEEIVFRYTIYRALRTISPHIVATIVTSLLFAAAHSNLAGFPCYVIFSLFLQEAFHRTKNLYIPIMMHSMFNLLMLTISLY